MISFTWKARMLIGQKKVHMVIRQKKKEKYYEKIQRVVGLSWDDGIPKKIMLK